MVPHLITALSGPINELEQRILDATPVIERWFRLEWMEHTPTPSGRSSTTPPNIWPPPVPLR